MSRFGLLPSVPQQASQQQTKSTHVISARYKFQQISKIHDHSPYIPKEAVKRKKNLVLNFGNLLRQYPREMNYLLCQCSSTLTAKHMTDKNGYKTYTQVDGNLCYTYTVNTSEPRSQRRDRKIGSWGVKYIEGEQGAHRI